MVADWAPSLSDVVSMQFVIGRQKPVNKFDIVNSLLHSLCFEARSMCFPVGIIHVRSRLFITRLNTRQQWRIGSLMADRLFVVGCDSVTRWTPAPSVNFASMRIAP